MHACAASRPARSCIPACCSLASASLPLRSCSPCIIRPPRPRPSSHPRPPLLSPARINGFSHLNLTKLDVLSGLPDIRVGVAYTTKDGRRLSASVPADIGDLEDVTVEFETLPGWSEDISAARSWGELPAAARTYVERVEALVGVPIKWIGVGPGRDAIVVKG